MTNHTQRSWYVLGLCEDTNQLVLSGTIRERVWSAGADTIPKENSLLPGVGKSTTIEPEMPAGDNITFYSQAIIMPLQLLL